ncbi:tetratricopeptide repeat protein [Brevundimonas lutea]|uniref:tetratricopeptide repeat protein n=1 Tax=Brevundimonas lutea TaxID=2293980 RepID=UPI000F041EBB|nr:hypothetical protein [Brevundimonas lutea]
MRFDAQGESRAARWRIAKIDRSSFIRTDVGLSYKIPEGVRVPLTLAFENGSVLRLPANGVLRLHCIEGSGEIGPGTRIICEFRDEHGTQVERIAKPFDQGRTWVRLPCPQGASEAYLTLGLAGTGALRRMVFTMETEAVGSIERLSEALRAGERASVDQALEAAKRYRSQDPALPRLQALAAWLARDYGEAADHYSRLADQDSLRGDDATRLFRSLKRAGRLAEAESAVSKFLSSPDMPDGLLKEWADLAAERGDAEDAGDRLGRLLSREGGENAVKSVLSQMLKRGQGGLAGAITAGLGDGLSLAVWLAEKAYAERRYVEAARIFDRVADLGTAGQKRVWRQKAEGAWMHAFARRSLASEWASGTQGVVTTAEQAIKRTGAYDVEFGGHIFPIRVKRGRGDKVLLLFHGAADQAVRPYPHFAGFLPGMDDVHQIAFADPTVACSRKLAAGWYLGTEIFPVQALLPGLITRLCDAVGAERRVYLGGSSGGFAALYCSWHDPDSFAVVANPQIDLLTYFEKPFDRLVQSGWPTLSLRDELARRVCLDVGQKYRCGSPNVVAYVQSRTDWRHIKTQLPAFLDAVAQGHADVAFDIGYWGVSGHSGSAPAVAYIPWVRAALKARHANLELLIEAHAEDTRSRSGPLASNDRPGSKTPGYAADITLADTLAALMLRPPSLDGPAEVG